RHGARNPPRTRRKAARPRAPLVARWPRGTARDGRWRWPLSVEPRRGDRSAAAQPRARATGIGGTRAAPRAALRQAAGRPLQSDQRVAQIAARLRYRRSALLAGAHAGGWRRPDLYPAAIDPRRGRGYRPRGAAGDQPGARRVGRL